MFFKNIEKWSKKRMWGVTAICYILYFILVILAPTITVMIKYDIFGKANGTYRNVTGFGIIVIVICGIASYVFMKKVLSKLPKVSVTEQRIRFGIECVFDLFPILIVLFAIHAVKEDLKLAFSTLTACAWFFLAAIIFNNLIIKFIDAEWDIRRSSKLDKEKAKRRDVV